MPVHDSDSSEGIAGFRSMYSVGFFSPFSVFHFPFFRAFCTCDLEQPRATQSLITSYWFEPGWSLNTSLMISGTVLPDSAGTKPKPRRNSAEKLWASASRALKPEYVLPRAPA